MQYLPPFDLTHEIVLKLVLASLFGGVVGLERQWHGKAAGLRTNMFICAGAALFTILSVSLAEVFGGDATRIASQLVPGIGFIGAGSILRSEGGVQGLTTAATIFVMASIGMAVGGGFYWTAGFATLTMLLSLLVLGWTEKKLHLKLELRSYSLRGAEAGLMLENLMDELEDMDLGAERVALRRLEEQPEIQFRLEATGAQHRKLMGRLHQRKLVCQMVPGEQDRRK